MVKFEKIYDEKIKYINKMNYEGLISYREYLKRELINLDKEIKKSKLTKEINYQIKYRKYIMLPLLAYIKNRIKKFNRVIHNGCSINMLKRFLEIAFKELTLKDFQRIYGLALTSKDIEEQSIQDIKDFMIESREIVI